MINSGIYIHIPFCEKKCNYCNFFSIQKNDELIDNYVNELCREISSIGKKQNEKILVDTIYLGGGTPSLLSPKNFDLIIDSINNNYVINNTAEITVEVNPNSAQYIEDYKKSGANRLSVGTQSINDDILKKLGRLHTASEAISTLRRASKTYDNISTDIILGCDENQNVKDEFLTIFEYVKHISAYILTVEENTPIYKQINCNSVSIATEDTVISQYEEFNKIASKYNFLRYETSNYCLPTYESKHNSRYWNLSNYLGFGAGAHSYFEGLRYYNESNVTSYLKGEHSGNDNRIIEREVSLEEDKYEFVMLSLRTAKGVDVSKYMQKFNSDVRIDFAKGFKKAEEYLNITSNYISIQPQFFLLQNAIERLILL